MKRFVCFLITTLFLVATVCAYEEGNQFHITESIPVYITDTGDCYHRYECEYLHTRKGAKLEDVFMYFRPCSFCNPPVVEWDPDEMCFFAVDVLVTSERGSSLSRILYFPAKSHPSIIPVKESEEMEEQAAVAKEKLERLEKKIQITEIFAVFVGIPCVVLGLRLEKRQWELEYQKKHK